MPPVRSYHQHRNTPSPDMVLQAQVSQQRDQTNYLNIFDRWNHSYRQLAPVLESFLRESAELDLALQLHAAGDALTTDETLQVNAALESLEVYNSKICQIRATLGSMRNSFKSLVPISRLPAELIGYILSLSEVKCMTNNAENGPGTRPIVPLANVMLINKRWRRAAVNTPSLWSHLDLVVGGPQEDCYLGRTQLCLTRSLQLPIHVHVIDHRLGYDAKCIRLIELLKPHAHRIASLHLQLGLEQQNDIIFGLFASAARCHAKELCLSNGQLVDETEVSQALSDSRLSHFLLPLQTLAMSGVVLPPNSPACRNLTTLKLVSYLDIATHLTRPDLMATLTCCPGLRSLTLIGYELGNYSPTANTISLPQLELLDLRQATVTQILGIISFITLSSNLQTFCVTFYEDMSEQDAARLWQHLAKAKIKRLFIENAQDIGDLNKLSMFPAALFSHVEELALGTFDFEPDIVVDPLDSSQLPYLRTLHLVGCRVSHSHCRQLVEGLAIDTIGHDWDIQPGEVSAGNVLPIRQRKYLSLCRGEDSLEWPMYTL
ncbi:F-box-like protein [Ceratobasidium sp. AG-Ba]|nr:F-box-like protein [Ceratobasidium sp. AG-Ba]QRW10757.1 F-box-like protein [Ceratobasidium sp. AG-Ba]